MKKHLFVYLFGFLFSQLGIAQLDSLLIKSTILERDIEVFIYENPLAPKPKQIFYLTDGKKSLDNGFLEQIKELTKAKKIPPAYYVFVSTIDPINQSDFRNEVFFCNSAYVAFFEQELVPEAEKKINMDFTFSKRSLIGVSFGGLNAVYFSAKASLFGGYGLLSPITYPCSDIRQEIVFSTNKHLKIFLSSGKNDAERYLQPLKEIYQSKGYKLEILLTKGGHDFKNWRNQLEKVISFLSN